MNPDQTAPKGSSQSSQIWVHIVCNMVTKVHIKHERDDDNCFEWWEKVLASESIKIMIKITFNDSVYEFYECLHQDEHLRLCMLGISTCCFVVC